MLLTFSAFVHIFVFHFSRAQIGSAAAARVVLQSCPLTIFPMFAAFNSGNTFLIALGFILGNPIIQASMYGPVGAFLADKYAPQDRYTGVSVSYQLGSVLGAGLAPLISTALVELSNGWGSSNIAIYFIFLAVVAAVFVWFVERKENNIVLTKITTEPAPVSANS